MKTEALNSKKNFRASLYLLPILMGNFLVATFAPFLNVHIIEVASSFEVTIGTTSQLVLVYRIVGLIMGLAMGFLGLKFKHKSLFLLGTAAYGIGALGSGFSPNFATILFFQIFFGIGSAMVNIVSFAFIGEFLPLEKKGPAVGFAWSTQFLSQILMPLMAPISATLTGWRFIPIYFIFPFSVLCFVTCLIFLPSKPIKNKRADSPDSPRCSKAFKQILSNKSAISCLTGSMLIQITFTLTLYVVSFYRLHFSMPILAASICATIAGIMGTLGTVIGGRLTNRIGRKTLTVTAGLFSGIFVSLFTFIPYLWFSVVFWFGAMFLLATTLVSLYSLILEQVPKFRCTLLSLNQTLRYAGTVLGATIGGIMLNIYENNFQILLALYAVFVLIMTAIVFAIARDS